MGGFWFVNVRVYTVMGCIRDYVRNIWDLSVWLIWIGKMAWIQIQVD